MKKHWFITLSLLVFWSACDAPAQVDAGMDAEVRDAEPAVDAGPVRFELPNCDASAGPFSPLSSRCGHFVDAEGRVVFLFGINARVNGVFDVALGPWPEGTPRAGEPRVQLEDIPALPAEDIARMRQLGFNVLRLPIQWSAIEPEDTTPRSYDEAYIARIQRVVDDCAAADLWVFLDFHQDAYSKEIGEDGAPLWAIQPPPTEILEGPLDDLDARRASAQTLAAFGTFFGEDEPGPTLRTRFSEMAAEIGRRFRDASHVIGYEVYNEPVASFAENNRLNFEVAAALRTADPDGLVIFEPPVTQRNLSERNRRPLEPFPVSGGVYAPHVYTLAFSAFTTEEQRQNFTRDTLLPGNESARREAIAWDAPLLISEWGYGADWFRWDEYMRWQIDLQMEFGASSALWLWKEESQGRWGLFDHNDDTGEWTERPAFRAIVSHPMAHAVAGWPTLQEYDWEAKVLTLEYEGSDAITAPTLLYVPAPEDFAANYEVRCDGMVVSTERNVATGEVAVACQGSGAHRVTLTALP